MWLLAKVILLKAVLIKSSQFCRMKGKIYAVFINTDTRDYIFCLPSCGEIKNRVARYRACECSETAWNQSSVLTPSVITAQGRKKRLPSMWTCAMTQVRAIKNSEWHWWSASKKWQVRSTHDRCFLQRKNWCAVLWCKQSMTRWKGEGNHQQRSTLQKQLQLPIIA